jgi:regulator of protease activity HflC (stomatin/prohibitin superfamily)
VVDKILEFVLGILDLFRFWAIIMPYERGIVLRLGKFNRELCPGMHWLIPLGVDHLLHDNVVPRTLRLEPQSLVTSDGHSVSVTGVVTLRIAYIQKAILEVESVSHAIVDCCTAVIAERVTSSKREELHTEPFREQLKKECRKEGWAYGLEIQKAALADICPSRTIRLLSSRVGH